MTLYSALQEKCKPYRIAVSCAQQQCSIEGAVTYTAPDSSKVIMLGSITNNSASSQGKSIYEEYRHKGMRCVEQLMGECAIVIWDAVKCIPVIIRGHMGSVPLFVYQDEERICISDHMSGLSACGIAGEVNWDAVFDYFSFFWVLDNKTFLRNVVRFPAGCIQVGRDKHIYWAYTQTDECTDPEQCSHILREHCVDIICAKLKNRKHVGCYLSGGIDSSILARVIHDNYKGRFTTYSLIGAGAKDESPWIDRVVQNIASEHVRLSPQFDAVLQRIDDAVGLLGEPMCYPSVLSRIYLAEQTHSDAVFVGRGVDEYFSGYTWHVPPYIANHLSRRRVFSKEEIKLIFPALQTRAYDPDEQYRALYETYPAYTPLEKTLHVDVHTLLRSWIEVEYACGRRFNHDVVMPFIDPTVGALAARISSRLKVHNGDVKFIVKKAFADMVPSEILTRPKMGLHTPFSQIIRTQSQEIASFLKAETTRMHCPEINVEYVCAQFEKHSNKEIDWGWQFWGVLSYIFFRKALATSVPKGMLP